MAWPKGRPRSPETIAKMSTPERPIEERYREKVDQRGPDECWPWLASTRDDGYGQIGVGGRRTNVAHRVGWTLTYGPIPLGAVVDHRCHNEDPACPGGACAHRACQNPAHWRLATRGGNVLAGKSLPARNALKTHCNAGHAFDAANTYVRRDGYRDCRRCKAERQAAYLARKKS